MKEAQRLIHMGVKFLTMRRLEDAAGCFEYALALEQRDLGEPSPRVMSYCGYTMALARKRLESGLKMCQKAVEKAFYSADLLCNLGEVYLACGDRAQAYRAFSRGRELSPGHSRISLYLLEMGARRPPILSFLPRSHVLNRFLGRTLRG